MGDAPAPGTSESTDEVMRSYVQHFPELMKINAENILPLEQAKLAANQATAPAYSKLQQELYSVYGPLLGQVSDKINAQSAANTAGSDLALMKGTGRDLIKETLATSKEADPEYYKAREVMGGRLADLLGSVDLSGKLSGGETEELNRSLAQENNRRGIAGTPNQTAALENAMTFGDARYQRQNNAKGQLAAALGVGNSFLPGAQSGIDTFKIATGKTSMPNAGDSKFQGVNQGIGGEVFNTGNNMLNNINQMRMQENDINSNRRDVLDRMNEVTNSLGSLS